VTPHQNQLDTTLQRVSIASAIAKRFADAAPEPKHHPRYCPISLCAAHPPSRQVPVTTQQPPPPKASSALCALGFTGPDRKLSIALDIFDRYTLLRPYWMTTAPAE
jgi:hypothetical protein